MGSGYRLVGRCGHINIHTPLGADLWPGIAVEGNRVIWGLTLRMLIDLFERLDRPLTIGL